METKQITARLDIDILEALKIHCKSKGLIINHFVQQSIIDKLQEVADIEDLKAIREEPTRPFSEVLKELNLDG